MRGGLSTTASKKAKEKKNRKRDVRFDWDIIGSSSEVCTVEVSLLHRSKTFSIMGEVIRQDPLQTLSYVLFELTGEKLYEIFHFITRNPYVSKVVRQVRVLFIVKRLCLANRKAPWCTQFVF